ncbi:hypothetical protein PCYB_125210 [Plasmodium cynomolgi strain B]|uniref:Uncharacterized protein n=1 Tax=Plasmodium cynomolgi (strain B) TaxID=1120755 RepID=K6UZ73_PLACD|nr:hypothetical protein PCYB_125210 [Plasmodium cynomolgi strain B]GAB67955.1 hypothetical protein PCYB_125210 [Plasmodium cynomolgi strain B]
MEKVISMREIITNTRRIKLHENFLEDCNLKDIFYSGLETVNCGYNDYVNIKTWLFVIAEKLFLDDYEELAYVACDALKVLLCNNRFLNVIIFKLLKKNLEKDILKIMGICCLTTNRNRRDDFHLFQSSSNLMLRIIYCMVPVFNMNIYNYSIVNYVLRLFIRDNEKYKYVFEKLKENYNDKEIIDISNFQNHMLNIINAFKNTSIFSAKDSILNKQNDIELFDNINRRIENQWNGYRDKEKT